MYQPLEHLGEAVFLFDLKFFSPTFFPSTLGGHRHKAQGTDSDSNDGGGDEGTLLLPNPAPLPFFDQQNKSLELVHDRK